MSYGKLKSHYDKHVVDGNEFGDISQNEYLKKAKEFAAESNPNFQETKVGNFNIKYDPVCFWEDDGSNDAEKYSGPNHMMLQEGKNNFCKFGAVKESLVKSIKSEIKQRYCKSE